MSVDVCSLQQELAAVTADIDRILGIAEHVKCGRTVNEVCDGIIRFHDQICDLQEERDDLRRRMEDAEKEVAFLKEAAKRHWDECPSWRSVFVQKMIEQVSR